MHLTLGVWWSDWGLSPSTPPPNSAWVYHSARRMASTDGYLYIIEWTSPSQTAFLATNRLFNTFFTNQQWSFLRQDPHYSSRFETSVTFLNLSHFKARSPFKAAGNLGSSFPNCISFYSKKTRLFCSLSIDHRCCRRHVSNPKKHGCSLKNKNNIQNHRERKKIPVPTLQK